jgi:hypothetical protein
MLSGLKPYYTSTQGNYFLGNFLLKKFDGGET